MNLDGPSPCIKDSLHTYILQVTVLRKMCGVAFDPNDRLQ